MLELIPSKKFLKDVEKFKKQPILRKKIAKTLSLLKSNPRHPGLNLERIINDKTAWSIQVDRFYRISIESMQQNNLPAVNWEGGIFLLRVLEHDDLYRSPH
jgi:mRNA-degrading endonuclease YafQ of YafQ-DinJ toxin-antitoxin module